MASSNVNKQFVVKSSVKIRCKPILTTRGYLTDIHHHRNMAGAQDVVERSMSINAKFLPRLKAAVEQNALLRIGWTGSGEEVPKNGEVGLCPGIPEGARIKALGKLGSWTSSFGAGGRFSVEGEVASFFGAYNSGSTVTSTGFIGRCGGFMMQEGTLFGSDGADTDLGMFMSDGTVYVQGQVGARVGNGMNGGLIIIQGDVEEDAGIGMKGGRIVIEGRCPTPPHGIRLRPLKAKEMKEINALLSEYDSVLSEDALCLEPIDEVVFEVQSNHVSSGDLSTIGLVPMDEQPLIENHPVDTVAFIPGTEDEAPAILLPIPILPRIPDGTLLRTEDNNSGRLTRIQSQPFLVIENPRPIDVVQLNLQSLCDLTTTAPSVAGVCMDLDSLPSMNPEELDGLLVAIRTLMNSQSPIMSIQGISRIQSHHQSSAYHEVQAAISRIEDGSGTPEASTLPIMGRSKKNELDNTPVITALEFGFTSDAHDVIVARCAGADFVVTEPPMLEIEDIEYWLQGLTIDLQNTLRNLGLDSIDILQRSHLRALDHDTASVSGLRMSGYERPLPHWFAR